MNHNSDNKEHSKKTVLEKIRKGEVKMRPMAYFIAKVIIIAIVTVCILGVSALLLSFMLFSIGISGRLFLLGFGWRGIVTFFLLFPWLFLAADILLLILLEWLLKEFSFVYHRPLIYLFLGGALISLAAAFMLNGLKIHNAILHENDRHRLPVIAPFYEHVRMPSEKKDIFAGTVTAIDGNTVTIQANDFDRDSDDGIRKVTIPPEQLTGMNIKIGDNLFVAGDLQDGMIQAYGVKQIGPGDHDE